MRRDEDDSGESPVQIQSGDIGPVWAIVKERLGHGQTMGERLRGLLYHMELCEASLRPVGWTLQTAFRRIAGYQDWEVNAFINGVGPGYHIGISS